MCPNSGPREIDNSFELVLPNGEFENNHSKKRAEREYTRFELLNKVMHNKGVFVPLLNRNI